MSPYITQKYNNSEVASLSYRGGCEGDIVVVATKLDFLAEAWNATDHAGKGV